MCPVTTTSSLVKCLWPTKVINIFFCIFNMFQTLIYISIYSIWNKYQDSPNCLIGEQHN